MKQVIEASYFIDRWHELDDELFGLFSIIIVKIFWFICLWSLFYD